MTSLGVTDDEHMTSLGVNESGQQQESFPSEVQDLLNSFKHQSLVYSMTIIQLII